MVDDPGEASRGFFGIEARSVSMERCKASVIDGDGEPHQVAVSAASLFAAVDQAIEQWSRLWWFNAGAVAEVQVGNRRWRVRVRRVISWRGGNGIWVQ